MRLDSLRLQKGRRAEGNFTVPAPIDIVYTTVGGVIGAALTQYVTHLRDRRTARAVIIEKVATAEAEYALLAAGTAGPPTDQKNADLSKLNAALASVEAACLIAGLPRANVTAYIVSRQLGAQVRIFIPFVAWWTGEVDRIKQFYEHRQLDKDKKEIISELVSTTEQFPSLMSRLDIDCAKMIPAALDELRRSVWNPFTVQLRKRKLYKLQKRLERFEVLVRSLEHAAARSQEIRIDWEADRVHN